MSAVITSLDDCKKFLEGRAHDINEIRESALRLYDQLTEEFSLPPTGDIRNAYFAHIVNHCNNMVLILKAVSHCLTDQRWLEQNVKSGSAQDLSILIEYLDKASRKDTFLGVWAYTENAIRRIRTVIKGCPAIGSIYCHCEALYRTDLSHSRASEFMELIELVTRTRNTCHNNFLYYPDRGGDKDLSYKGQLFEFKVGQPLNFFSWNFVKSRIRDMLELYEQTVRAPQIVAIKNIKST
jgi:hypothetical protein